MLAQLMDKTINFCGDSFCASQEDESWTKILAQKLGYKILGFGKPGAAHEHAFISFDPSADVTIFCWTEPDRLHHSEFIFSSSVSEEYKKRNIIYASAYGYYKYVHDHHWAKRRQMRELYWFDHEVLSEYKGKIIHCWSFNHNYDFTHGKIYETPLIKIEPDFVVSLNHMTPENNKLFANQLYEELNG